MDALEGLGVDYKALTDKLEADGVKAFADSYESLLAGVMAKKAALVQGG
jgi:transaldolase